MKGTLFSADFVKDGNDNLRLLELNTDTAFTNGALTHVDFIAFNNLLTESNITELHVIYKEIHSNFVDALTTFINANNPAVSFYGVKEEINTIYPTTIEDSPSKFILRCAYDESAIFDSTYCKQKNELFKLFHQGNASDAVAEAYINSAEYQVDLLNRVVNTDISPDVVVKDLTNTHKSIEFYKIKGAGTVEENFSSFINEIGDEKIALNYYENTSESTHTSERSFNIIYGDNLDILNLTNVRVTAVLEKPTLVEFDTNSSANILDEKHYFEFTSNFPTPASFHIQGGIFEDEEITDVNGNGIRIADTVIGDTYKSLLVSGSPDSDSSNVYTDWFAAGEEIPETEVTSSILINKVGLDLSKKLINKVTLANSASFRANAIQAILVYDSADNGFRYKRIFDIDPATDKLIKTDSTKVDIASNVIEVLEGEHQSYILDLETADTFVLHGNDINLKIVSHNCFPAGTRILLGDGTYKNIEELSTEDVLTTYNEKTKTFGKGTLGSIRVTKQNHLVEIKTDSGDRVKSTPGHKFFTIGNGWKMASELEIGDKLFTKGGFETSINSTEVIDEEVEVFHLIDVDTDHTYFAENLLVHNFKGTFSCFPAGTEITLSNGDVKNIEDIVEGDVVVSYNETSGEKENKSVYETLSPVHDDLVTYKLEDGSVITSTHDHPFYVKGLNLKSFNPQKSNVLYKLDKPVAKVELGDEFIKLDGKVSPIVEIIEEVKETQTYLLRVEDNFNFYANSILVHNK